MAYKQNKNSFFRNIGRGFLKLAFVVATVGGPAYYRFGTVEEHEAIVRDLRGDKEKGYRVSTNKGGFQNEDSWLRLNISEDPQEIQDQLYKGRTYRFTTYGGIGPLTPNIVAIEEVGGTGLTEATQAPIETPGETSPALMARGYNEGAGEGYPLTQAEKEMSAQFFGGDLELDKLRLHFYSAARSNAATTFTASSTMTATYPDGTVVEDRQVSQHIEFYGKRYAADDYSRETGFNFGTFLHEMTHVWQGQMEPGRKHYEDGVYEYTLFPSSTFDALSDEQQASVVDDYANRFLQETPQPSIYYRDAKMADTSETDALLQKVVESKFPGAAALRQKAERERGGQPSSSLKETPKQHLFRTATIPLT